MLRVEGLSKRYGRTWALREMTFSLEKGAIFGFVGPNGAGKTTTMKIVATLLAPTSGKAWIGDDEVTRSPGRVRRRIGYMPDFFGVYDDLKVSEYLDFFAAAYRVPRSQRKKTADDLLELVDLGHKRDEYVDSLSRGMKQRLCLARCLVHDPDVLLLDEPASGLDPRARVEMRELLKELRNMGKTILISSHILSELAEMCTHIGIVDNGRLVVSGRVDEILLRLQHDNMLQVRVLAQADRAAEILSQQPGIGGASVDGDLVLCSFQGTPGEMSGALVALVSAGIPVVSFSESQNRLEEVFMRITQGVSE